MTQDRGRTPAILILSEERAKNDIQHLMFYKCNFDGRWDNFGRWFFVDQVLYHHQERRKRRERGVGNWNSEEKVTNIAFTAFLLLLLVSSANRVVPI